MRVIFHRLIQKDIRAALSYYDAEGGQKLGDRFFEEVERAVVRVTENPRGFPFIEQRLRRRVPFQSFPYHMIFEERANDVRFLVLRHDKRHPSFGLRRI